MRAPPRRSDAPPLLLLVVFVSTNLLVVPSCLVCNNAAEAATVPPTSDGHLAETLSTYTHVRRTPKTVDEAIHMHCGEVLRVLENKWLPTARTDPVTQERVLHVGFLGDSLSYFYFTPTVRNIAICVKGRWDANMSMLHTVPGGPPPWARAEFSTTSTLEGDGAMSVVTRIVVSYAVNRYSTDVASFLRELYENQHVRNDATDADQNMSGSGWPSWVDGPSPHILYVAVGAWDCLFPRRKMHGYDHIKKDVFGQQQNITWPYRLERMDKKFGQHFTQPMRGLVNSWNVVVSGAAARGDLNGTRTAATYAGPRRSFYFSPPDHLFLVSTPFFGCYAPFFNVNPGDPFWYRFRHFKGFMRCSTLLTPAAEIVRNHFHAVINTNISTGNTGVSQHRQRQPQTSAPGTRLMFIDGNDYRDRCTLDDGVHFTLESPTCWERLLLAFWGLF